MMRGGKKYRGIYFVRKRRRSPWIFLALTFAVVISIVIIYLQEVCQNRNERELPKRAAILDGLSIDYPNRTFIESAVRLLNQAGYEVDIYSSESMSLELLRALPTKDYDLLIFRAHGGRIRQPIGLFLGGGLFIERCGPDSHVEEIKSGYLLIGRPFFSNETYCVVPPHYITDKLEGRFRGTVIIAMSCFTGNDNIMASAFFDRGAGAYIGFSGEISPDYADAFTIALLRKLYIEKLPIREAFDQVKRELGPDPHYGGTPTLYLP